MDYWSIFRIVFPAALGILGLVRRREMARGMFLQARPPGITSPDQLVPTAIVVSVGFLMFALFAAFDLLLGP